MGNTRQQFYDEFPEGHPESATIMRYIRMLDRDDVNDGWYEFVRDCLSKEMMSSYIRKALVDLTLKMEEFGDDEDFVKDALLEIDRGYRVEYLNVVAKRAERDHILQLLIYKEKEWEADAKRGFNVYTSIKSFGRVLFENYRDQTKGHHWARYRRVRNKYAPRVVARGVDINRCGIQDLMSALKLTREQAKNLWHARPFDSLGQARNQGYIDRSSFADSKEMDECLSMVEAAFKEAEERLQLSVLSAVTSRLVRKQQVQKDKSPELQHEWRMVWSYYRILRDDLTRKINDKRQEENEQQEDGFRFLEDHREIESSSASRKETGPEAQEAGSGATPEEDVGGNAGDSDGEARLLAQQGSI